VTGRHAKAYPHTAGIQEETKVRQAKADQRETSDRQARLGRPANGRHTGRNKAYRKPKVRQADRQANERQVTGRHV
jgi:hypothetical protein